MRNDGVNDATSISESKSTTTRHVQLDSEVRIRLRTVFPLRLYLDEDLVLAHDLHNLPHVTPGFV